MAPTAAQIRAQSTDLRALGWSYRRIAAHWQLAQGLGARLAFRLAHGWTQEDAARRWNERWPDSPKTGKSFSYWETWPAPGGRAPSPLALARLAELYLCRPGDLLDGLDHGVLDPGLDAGGGLGGCRHRDRHDQGCLAPDGRRDGAGPPDPDFELDLGLSFGQQFWYPADALRG
ncbi:helix-turn-helix transcriptional regulator [Pseudofrankia sp. BMG5.36]|uniref:helix-turn-helix domain-containing protein n=1 Tax=Pseudofrankia sp. BMG5.36 TaxID=1834512 RepID=UPI000A8CDB90|nr:helix-turn-helix transcriptional regulator [Pseudofrankia sp. BMG5.36]